MNQKYPLKDLLRVRKFREDAAAKELTRCRGAVEKAKELVQDRKQELQDYIKWRIRKEARLYEDLFRKPVKLTALEELKQDIQQLREKEVLFHDSLQEAEKALREAETAVEDARRVHQDANKNVQKIEEHHELWAQDLAKLNEADEEKELEDFRVRHRENVDSTAKEEHV